MLNDSTSTAFHFPGKALWNVLKHNETPLGCSVCPDLSICGGVQINARVFSCLDLCCGNPTTCDKVCRHNAREFAHRLREVSDWTLHNVPRRSPLPNTMLPRIIPLIYHASARKEPFIDAPTVCLPFFSVVERNDGSPRFSDMTAVAKHFGIGSGEGVVLTGTARDRSLERWWSLGVQRRRVALRKLRDMGIEFMTTPNYSLFTDVPRWDNLFSIKRIAIAHEECLAEGIAAGLHVNARTERDSERWVEYVRDRPEITHIAYEFATGAERGSRLEWHAQHLERLAREVDRPLHLVVRGGTSILPRLMSVYAEVTFIDTNAFTKTRARQKAGFVADQLRWTRAETGKDEPLDDLLSHNWKAVTEDFELQCGKIAPVCS